MISLRPYSIPALIVILASAGATFTMWRQLEVERLESAALREQLARVQQLLAAHPQPDLLAPVAPAKSAAPGAESRLAAAAESGDTSALKGLLEPFFAASDDAGPGKDPAYRGAMRAQQRLSIGAAYADFARLLKLSSGQAERLFDLMTDQMMEYLDAEYSQQAELQGQHDLNLTAILGQRGFAQLKQYEGTLAYRSDVERLQDRLHAGHNELNDDQAEALIKVIQDANLAMDRVAPTAHDYAYATPEERQLSLAKSGQLRRERDARIRDSAAALLKPAQLAAFDRLIRDQQAQSEAGDRSAEEPERTRVNGQ